MRIDGRVRSLVLRRIDKEPWLTHAAELLGREAGVMELLRDSAVPAPRLVRVESPRLLMTRLPGALRLGAPDVHALARTLVAIHAIPHRPREYQSWAHGKGVPEWGDRELWEWAIGVIEQPAPAYRGVFLHRDFHPGNVLFDGDAVSGVVDWVETSFGPADLDVAHCCTNLAMLEGLGAVERFRAAYVAAGGELSGDPYWQVLDLVGMLPDPIKMVGAWRDAGRTDLTAEIGRARLEAYARSLRASSSLS